MIMQKLLTMALALLLALSAAKAQPVYESQAMVCAQSASASGVSAATQLVPAVTGKRVYLCGYVLNAGAAASTFQINYGTGSNCGTGTTAVGPLYSLAINGVLVDRSPFYSGIATPSGQALCVTPSTASSVTVYYTQF